MITFRRNNWGKDQRTHIQLQLPGYDERTIHILMILDFRGNVFSELKYII